MTGPVFNQCRRLASYLLSASIPTVTIFAALGAGLGYIRGSAYARLRTQALLASEAHGAEVSIEDALESSQLALSRINQSTLPICSESDLEDLRRILYERSFIRDIGHMHNGQLDCSASFPRASLPLSAGVPTISSVDGVSIYRNIPFFKLPDGPVLLLERGNAFVVIDPDALIPRREETIQTTMFDISSAARVSLDGSPDPIPLSLRKQAPQGQFGATIYAVECTDRFQTCTVATEPISGVYKRLGGLIALHCLIGGLASSLLLMIVSRIRHREKSLAVQLRRAISQNQIRTVYQPIVDLRTRRIVEAEALARWKNEEGIDVNPEAFVREAEQGGFIYELTVGIIKRALSDFKSVFMLYPDFRLNVNVTATDLIHPDFLRMLQSAVQQVGASPQNLALEITEGSTAERSELIPVIKSLRFNGYSVQIDDFGTGYSSLSRLRDLDVDCLKIDRSLTQAAGLEGSVVSILPQIISIANALDLGIIVEGIETEKQAQHFAHAGTRLLGQGWLFGRPVASSEFKMMLMRNKKSVGVATRQELESNDALLPAVGQS